MVKVDEGDPKIGPLEAPYIKLYTAPTPNGWKISIFLELLGLHYITRYISMRDDEQHEDWYEALNLNGKIPVLSDVDSEGNRITISESLAILLYLAEKYDVHHKFSYAPGTKLYWEQMEWSLFQMASLGPNQGQLHHFSFAAPERNEYGIKRYGNETRRLYKVLDTRLAINGLYLVGDHVSIADVLTIGWVSRYERIDFDLENDFPNLYKWYKNLRDIPEFEKGFSVPVVS